MEWEANDITIIYSTSSFIPSVRDALNYSFYSSLHNTPHYRDKLFKILHTNFHNADKNKNEKSVITEIFTHKWINDKWTKAKIKNVKLFCKPQKK